MQEPIFFRVACRIIVDLFLCAAIVIVFFFVATPIAVASEGKQERWYEVASGCQPLSDISRTPLGLMRNAFKNGYYVELKYYSPAYAVMYEPIRGKSVHMFNTKEACVTLGPEVVGQR